MSKPLKLLLVEDSLDDAELVLAVLRAGGYDPVHRRVQTGDALRLALREEGWDLVLSDYSMPGFDAPAALGLIREDGRGIPVIVISGTVGEDVAVETLQLGAVDYLIKGNLTRLIPAIENALSTAEETRRRRLAESTLRRNAQIFAQLGESVLCTDLQGAITYWNEAASALHGWRADEMLGHSVSELFPMDDAVGSRRQIAAALACGKFAGEVQTCRKDGSVVWVELHVTPLLDETNAHVGFIGVARDISERRQREEALLLRDRALAEVSQGVLICDENHLITYANSGFCGITGYDAADVLGRKCSILQGVETDPRTVLRIRDALARQAVFEGEILNYRKDGTPFWNEISIAPIPGENGSPVRFIGVQRDVTERKKAEETLRHSEERLRQERALLRALIDSIPDLIFFKDRDSVFLGCNKAFEEKMGVSQDSIPGKTDYDLVPREIAEFYREKDIELLASGVPQRTEEWIPFKDGSGGFFETLKTPYFGPNGESLGLIGVSRDITERRRSEEQLRAALDRMELAAKSARAGIWELDLVADQAIWDDQMFALFGLSREKAAAGIDRWFRQMHAEDLPLCEALIAELHAGRDAFDIEFRIFRANDQAMRFVRSMGVVKRDDSGRAVRIVGINHDVTEERLREKALSEAFEREKELARKARAGERAKSEFLAVMSHEIRTPMNGILGFADLLGRSAGLPADCREYAGTIITSSEALLRILDDILDFSRLESGRLLIDKSWFNPREMLRDIKTLIAPQAEEKKIGFEMDVAEDIPVLLEGDAGRLRQILLNLAGNAIKFTERGSVRLGLRRCHQGEGSQGLDLEFFVKDTGPGIPCGCLDHIFEPFTQADSSISRRHGGTGLGLTISRRLTELMDGRLTVESEAGRGSEFVVHVPFRRAKDTADAAPGEPVEPLDDTYAQKYPLKILVVEDDRVNLRLIETILRKFGYAPITAQNGLEAVELHASERPDCVLMDIQMPVLDGIEASRRIRAANPPGGKSTFIAALTANTIPADRQRCFAAGMNDYLNKPVKRTDLASILRRAAQGR